MDEHTLNDLLECSVCLERLDTSSKVLPCQHTFCRKCLEVIYASRQELRCPECRILVDTKIEDLPPNVLLMRILEGMKNAASKQHSIINEISNELRCAVQPPGSTILSTNSTVAAVNANILNEERIRQQIQQQQMKQRQQQILQFQQQIQQQHHLNQQQNQTATTQQQPHLLQQQQTQNQQRRCIVPHAYALYDFESNEINDLKFKKGDLIFLKRKIDTNWYLGQLKGTEGNFPINYVQVVVPLPTSQCVALYDFKMGPNEEEGCLTFKKGTVIQVLRRVDHNWAEGRIGNSIGIFPIAFVELNQLAKQLLEGFTLSSASAATQPTTQQNPQVASNDVRNLPPLPPNIDTTKNNNNGDSTISSSSVSSTTNTISSSSSSSTTTSPTTTSVNLTTSSNNASFHSMPNSPQSSTPTTPQHSMVPIANSSNSVRMRNNELKHKRHSLNALLNNGSTALSIMQTNRHSAEILSVPNDFDNEPSCSTNPVCSTSQILVDREQQLPTANTLSVNNQNSQNFGQNDSAATTVNISQHSSRHNVLKTCVQQNVPPSLPWGYLALYPYKPRKNDELELKKGCVYMVTERCLDGWFKGKNWKEISGVFPGNYVTPLRARDQQQLMHSWKLIPPTGSVQTNSQNPTTNATTVGQETTTATPSPICTSSQQQLSPSYPSSMRNDLENINARLTLANLTPHQALPPDLPPRYLNITPTSQPVTNSNTINILTKENRDKEAQKEKPTTTGCISTSSSSSGSTSSGSTGLKKFLTHIKSRSKSPSAAVAAAATSSTNAPSNTSAQTLNNTKHQQPAQHLQIPNNQSLHNQQTNVPTSSTLTPVHVRSGSCPSQLLQNLPSNANQQGNKKTAAIANVQHTSPQNNFQPSRIKGSKERASLENTRPTIDSTLRSIYANHLQQQSALMANKCGQQQHQQQNFPLNSNNNFNNSTTAIHHRKSHSLDASNILQTSPITPTPSSSVSLSGGNSGGISVAAAPQCNINAAAIHASATTKSTQNISESRFRCVVPYPPNSDVELELQVGDIIFVYRKQKNGWYKGTNSRTYKTGLFPASFVEPDL